jgi:hypothetical protein
LDFGFEQEANNGGVVGPSSPPSGGCFSQSWNWPVGFDHNGEIVVWEEEEDDYWNGLPLDWAMDGDFGEEALAIWDAMEEEFLFFACQKTKGKKGTSKFAEFHQLWRHELSL